MNRAAGPPSREPRLRRWARRIKRDTLALYLASRDPRVPWYAKALAAITVAYALSPIDLIPDFVPVLGQLDDLILVPLGIAVAVRWVPAPVMNELRATAERQLAQRPRSSLAGVLIVLSIWLAVGAIVVALIAHTGPLS